MVGYLPWKLRSTRAHAQGRLERVDSIDEYRATGMTDKPNMRRIIRVNRLLSELGHTDVIEALAHMQRMVVALREIGALSWFTPLDATQVHRKCVDAIKRNKEEA